MCAVRCRKAQTRVPDHEKTRFSVMCGSAFRCMIRTQHAEPLNQATTTQTGRFVSFSTTIQRNRQSESVLKKSLPAEDTAQRSLHPIYWLRTERRSALHIPSVTHKRLIEKAARIERTQIERTHAVPHHSSQLCGDTAAQSEDGVQL
jgi:hypothetical protein